jgi:hypothetical protein
LQAISREQDLPPLPIPICGDDLAGVTNDLVEIRRTDFERPGSELGTLKALGEALIETGILLRQNDRFMRDAIVVEIAEKQLSENSIGAFAGEDDPSAVA